MHQDMELGAGGSLHSTFHEHKVAFQGPSSRRPTFLTAASQVWLLGPLIAALLSTCAHPLGL